MQPRLENRCWLEGNGSTRPRYFLVRRGGIIVENYFDNPPLLWRTPATINPRRFFIPPPSLPLLLFKLLSSLPWKCVFFLSFFLSFFFPSFHRSPESPTFRSRDRDVTVGSLTTCKPRFIWVDLSVSCVVHEERKGTICCSRRWFIGRAEPSDFL